MKKYRVSQKELLTDAVDETIPGKIWKKYLDTKIKMLQTNCLEHGVFLPPSCTNISPLCFHMGKRNSSVLWSFDCYFALTEPRVCHKIFLDGKVYHLLWTCKDCYLYVLWSNKGKSTTCCSIVYLMLKFWIITIKEGN